MKILLIEDDKNLCNMIKQQLTKESYIVDACTSGEDGMIYALNPDNGYVLCDFLFTGTIFYFAGCFHQKK